MTLSEEVRFSQISTSRTVKKIMLSTTACDEFLSSEYDAPLTSYPFAQIINDKYKSQCGFFISTDNLSQADFQIPDDAEYHTVVWGSGERSQGLLIDSPRLLVIRSTPLYMEERSTGLYLGGYDAGIYRYRRQDIVLKTKYLIFFVSEDNQLLHSIPMQLTMKGVAGATFGEHLSKFRSELEQAFAVAYGVRVARKNEKFHAHGVFHLTTAPEQRGDEYKVWVCVTTGHEQPTQDNWRSLFVGYNSDIKDVVTRTYEASADFSVLKKSQTETTPGNSPAPEENDTDGIVF